MTAKERETEQAHLSNSIATVGQVGLTHSGMGFTHSASDGMWDRSRNWGWLLSTVISLNILILGCALASGSAYNNVDISSADLQVYLIILILLTTLWMISYIIYTAREDQAVLYHDSHAGPVWLRGGLVLFGVLSLIMDIFKIANYVGYLHCDSAVKVAFPVIQAVFIVVQTYFLWVHAKDCVQLQRNLTRCGLMLTLSTNLVLWMTAVTEESVHQTSIPEALTNTTKLSNRRSMMLKASYGDDYCKCSYSSCSIFKEAYYYLYPFNIEYSLFASAMSYVMWKNVGRQTDEHKSHHSAKFRFKDVLLGPIAGIFLVIAGLATFIVYELDVEKDDYKKRDKALMMHFVTNLVILILMSACTVVGCAIFRLDHREHVSEKNPTRSLDVGLLVGASMGQFVISYFTIVAVVATGAKGYLNALNLVWALFTVIELGLQNLFIIEGLHREPFHEPETVTVVSNPYVLQGDKELCDPEGSCMDVKASPVLTAHSLHSHSSQLSQIPDHKQKLTWKRRILKEICAFLLLSNIILWIMPAFGARPQFDHAIETEFYKFNMWAAIVNIGLPFGIFYRMHSVASLFEVYLTS